MNRKKYPELAVVFMQLRPRNSHVCTVLAFFAFHIQDWYVTAVLTCTVLVTNVCLSFENYGPYILLALLCIAGVRC
jgi:hypothetical protein